MPRGERRWFRAHEYPNCGQAKPNTSTIKPPRLFNM